MKVRFRTNIGSRDARQLGLDSTRCLAGSELAVSDDSANWLLKRGFAEEVDEPKVKRKAMTLNAVEPRPSQAEAKEPEIKE